jgi:Tol biopolymer transport system component
MAADGAPQSRKVITQGKIGWVPNWSPDGKQLTFVVWTKKQGVNIDTSYIINADGKSEPVKLNNQDAGTRTTEVEWSPDGKTLVFSSDREVDEKVKTEPPLAPAAGAR